MQKARHLTSAASILREAIKPISSKRQQKINVSRDSVMINLKSKHLKKIKTMQRYKYDLYHELSLLRYLSE